MFSLIGTFLIMKNKVDATLLIFTMSLDAFIILLTLAAVFGN